MAFPERQRLRRDIRAVVLGRFSRQLAVDLVVQEQADLALLAEALDGRRLALRSNQQDRVPELHERQPCEEKLRRAGAEQADRRSLGERRSMLREQFLSGVGRAGQDFGEGVCAVSPVAFRILTNWRRESDRGSVGLGFCLGGYEVVYILLGLLVAQPGGLA